MQTDPSLPTTKRMFHPLWVTWIFPDHLSPRLSEQLQVFVEHGWQQSVPTTSESLLALSCEITKSYHFIRRRIFLEEHSLSHRLCRQHLTVPEGPALLLPRLNQFNKRWSSPPPSLLPPFFLCSFIFQTLSPY